MPEEARRDSFEDEGTEKRSTTRVLVMLAVLVSLVAVLGMLQLREKHNQAVLWPTAPFEAGVAVQRVVFHPVDATATVTVDEVGWRALSAADQNAIGLRYAQIAAPKGVKEVHVVGSTGLPLTATTGNDTRVLPAPAVP